MQCLSTLKTWKKETRKTSPKEAEAQPWDTLCVDLIGKYQFTTKGGGAEYKTTPSPNNENYKSKTKNGNTVYLQAITMIDPATGWVEIRTVPDLVANQVELAWLTRYPLPTKVVLDRGNELLAEFKNMIEHDYVTYARDRYRCFVDVVTQRLCWGLGLVLVQ